MAVVVITIDDVSSSGGGDEGRGCGGRGGESHVP